MTLAADGIKSIEQRALASQWLKIGAAVVVVLVVLGGVAYCAGKSSQQRADSDAAYKAKHQLAVDAIRVYSERLRVDTVRVKESGQAATVARATHAAAAARIAIVDDSTVRVDSGPPVHVLPASIAIPEIRTCNATVAADTIDARATAAQISDLQKWGNAESDRADAAEDRLAQGQPRFGLKSGIAIGVAATLAVIKAVLVITGR